MLCIHASLERAARQSATLGIVSPPRPLRNSSRAAAVMPLSRRARLWTCPAESTMQNRVRSPLTKAIIVLLKARREFACVIAAAIERRNLLGHPLRIDAAYVAPEGLPGPRSAGRALALQFLPSPKTLFPGRAQIPLRAHEQLPGASRNRRSSPPRAFCLRRCAARPRADAHGPSSDARR
jgi:hypothetical protein